MRNSGLRGSGERCLTWSEETGRVPQHWYLRSCLDQKLLQRRGRAGRVSTLWDWPGCGKAQGKTHSLQRRPKKEHGNRGTKSH